MDLRPFEITGRNEWYRAHRYFERQDSMWRDALALYRADRLGRKDREDMELILQVMNYNDMQFASPRDMNSSMTMGYLTLREYILYQNWSPSWRASRSSAAGGTLSGYGPPAGMSATG